jgi:uncharacterized oxidoreductase
MRLDDATFVVTGGTSGIGLELTARLLARGSAVIACGRRAEKLDELRGRYPRLAVRRCDVTDESQRRELAAWVAQHHPKVNVLVNNAAVQLLVDLTREVDLPRVRAEIETNLTAPIHFASLFVPQLAGKEDASIVNISSGLAFSPLALMPVYCATKAAIHSLTMSLRRQVRDMGITVYEIAPPSVDSQLGRERWQGSAQSHGGMPVPEFVDRMIEVLEQGTLEVAIGQAEGMRAKREQLFDAMNH